MAVTASSQAEVHSFGRTAAAGVGGRRAESLAQADSAVAGSAAAGSAAEDFEAAFRTAGPERSSGAVERTASERASGARGPLEHHRGGAAQPCSYTGCSDTQYARTNRQGRARKSGKRRRDRKGHRRGCSRDISTFELYAIESIDAGRRCIHLHGASLLANFRHGPSMAERAVDWLRVVAEHVERHDSRGIAIWPRDGHAMGGSFGLVITRGQHFVGVPLRNWLNGLGVVNGRLVDVGGLDRR